MELQQIGLRHPAAELVRNIQHNRTGIPRRMFVAEGLYEHNIVLAAGVRLDTFLWCPEAAYSDEARKRSAELAARARRSYQISARTLERLAERPGPDGLLSIARLRDGDPAESTLGARALVLVADGIEIPGNLGTLFRTLDACAADCLVLTNRRTRLTHPKVLRASQGMSIRVPAVEFDQVAEAAAWLAASGCTVYLADTGHSASYRSADYGGKDAAAGGNQRHGISAAWYGAGFRPGGLSLPGSAGPPQLAPR